MFEYLVTSKTRRALLKLLWADGRAGTVTQFAEWADVAFAGAHKELNSMERAGLAEYQWEDGHKVFSCVQDHPMKRVVKELVKSEKLASKGVHQSTSLVKEELAYLGLPVNAAKRPPKPNTSLEALFASACNLARDDASVARALPVLLSRFRNELNYELLQSECKSLGQKHTMGFFLQLSGHLSGDKELEREAERFRDHRRTKLSHFFNSPSKLALRNAEEKTPDLAKNWAWLMNMSMDSFTSTFDKFSNAAAHAN